MSGDFSISRRRLPHWRVDGSYYFVTWRMAKGQPRLKHSERDLVVSALKHFHNERYTLLAFVVMDDHVHVAVNPFQDYSLSNILHSWKSHTANQLQRRFARHGRIWQDESYDRIIREENELIEKLEYILTNPQRRWPGIKDYAWADWIKTDHRH